jgi:flavorubredoxin
MPHQSTTAPVLSNQTPDQEGQVLFQAGEHRWIWLGADTDADVSAGVAANQYLIEHRGRCCLLDPGSVLDFARSVANVARYTATDRIDILFYSHQDPDVSSGAPMWAAITSAKLVMPGLWTRFLPHFGEFDESRIHGLDDAGEELALAGATLQVVPAHFLHAPGNQLLYDPQARILFSGDVGANLPPSGQPLFIDDFQAHLPYLEGFHQRYMACNTACRVFVDRIRHLDIDLICPQHGSIYRGQAAQDFLHWLEQLRCGIDLMS